MAKTLIMYKNPNQITSASVADRHNYRQTIETSLVSSASLVYETGKNEKISPIQVMFTVKTLVLFIIKKIKYLDWRTTVWKIAYEIKYCYSYYDRCGQGPDGRYFSAPTLRFRERPLCSYFLQLCHPSGAVYRVYSYANLFTQFLLYWPTYKPV